jgi:GrpB-like predicted nucleotidyltransferase (UPF0157 family)
MENQPSIEESKIEIIEPSPEVMEKADGYMTLLREIVPDATISLIGSLAIPVALKNEIDLLIEIEGSHDMASIQEKIREGTGDMFHIGPVEGGEGFMRSKKKYGIICELHILHRGDARIDRYHEIVRRFRSEPDLAKKYDSLKRSLHGASYEVYKAEKAKFFHEYSL